MAFPVLAAGLLGGSSLLGNIIGGSINRKNTKSTIQANRELADLEWQRNQEMWHMQNRYNSPQMQMARLKNAGLNPNLIYGSGSQAASGNATQMAKYQAPKEDHSYEVPNFTPSLSMFADMAVKKAQVDNLEANNSRIIQQTATDAIRASNISQNTAKTEFDLNLAKQLEQNSLDVARQNLQKIKADTLKTTFDTIHTQTATKESNKRQRALDLEYDLDSSLKPLGMTSRDPYLLRMIAKWLFGNSPAKNAIPNWDSWRKQQNY